MKLTFNKKFYNLRAIKKTAEAYNQLADFDIEEEEEEIKVELSNIDKDVKSVIEDEFKNYALALMQEIKTEDKNE